MHLFHECHSTKTLQTFSSYWNWLCQKWCVLLLSVFPFSILCKYKWELEILGGWGGRVEKLYKVSMRAVLCLEGFGTVSDWLVQVCCVWRELTCFSSQYRLVPQKSLRLGSGITPWCFKEYSFWMQDLFNKIVLSSVWYYILIITV